MIFRLTALFFLTLATAILLTHNVVPHSHNHLELASKSYHSHGHHHEADVSGIAHQHEDANSPGEDHPDVNKDLADILSVISHYTEGITFLTDHKNSNAVSRQLSTVVFLISETFWISELIFPPLLNHAPAEFFECTPFYPCTNTLRGPPSIAL